MAPRKLAWRIDATQQGARLDHVLAAALSTSLQRDITRAQTRSLIESGAASRDGRPERRASFQPTTGMRIEVRLDPAWPDSAPSPRPGAPEPNEFSWSPARIRFEDKWLLAVDKPPGLPTQPTLDARRASVFSTLQAWLRARNGDAAYLGLHHRLDRDTSGLLLFTKDPAANAGVSALFSGKTLRKTYQALAVAGGGAPESWTVENHLGAVGRLGKATRFGAVRSGGDPAQTGFRILERLPAALFVEARPLTGRTHQIRVHLAEGGHPILGDALYGGPTHVRPGQGHGTLELPRVMLHAAGLEFVHPLTGAPVNLTCPLPDDFTACLRALRAPPARTP